MIYYVVQLECRALHFSVDFIDETNQHERTHVHKINEQRINRQIELIHHIRDAKPFRLKHLPQRTRCYWWTKIIAFENGKLKEAYVRNLSNVLNPFTQNEWNISQMMQAIQITHTRNAYLFMFFSGSSLQFRYEHVSRASMMQHHIIQTVDFLVFGHTERLANRYVARVTQNWHLLHELTFIITLISKFDITLWQWAHVREYICSIQRQIAFQQLRCSKIMTREVKKTKPTKMLHINVNTHNLLSGNWSCATFLLNIFRLWDIFFLSSWLWPPASKSIDMQWI